ncbi:tetratricopeptide repeat protein [Massilia glaciei]|uniref:Tetratricopeptide repeat protein n=1 Tax=Massilia glaciei TaxID=1524097 RepID=A0A2U2HMU8_9BURK|nr:tetratricopeptide repeat protein [Massilia glaciei]
MKLLLSTLFGIAALCAPACHGAATDALEARIAAASKATEKDRAAGLAMLDQMLAQTGRENDQAGRRAVQYARCMALAEVDPAATARLAATMLAESNAAGDAGSVARFRVCAGYAGRGAKPEAALDGYEVGVAEGRRLGDRELLARALSLRGELRAHRGLYGSAIDDLKAAYALELALGNVGGQRYTLNAIANLYADRNVKDYEKALPYYQKLLAANTEEGNVQGQATAHFNIASTLESMGRLAPALESFRRALALATRRGLPDDIAYDERAVGIVLSKLGQHDAALVLLNRVVAHYAKVKDAESEAMARLSRGAALRRAGRFAQALPDIRASLAYFSDQKNQRFLEKIHEEHALALGGLGQWEAAFAARGEHMKVQQALQQLMLDERVALLRVQFQSEQARMQNEALARDNASAQRELAASGTVTRWQYAALALSLVAILALVQMVVRQVRLGARMRDLAMIDELTRLPNRRHFMAVANEAFARAPRRHRHRPGRARHRPVQEHQRHPRPRGRRHGAAAHRARPARGAAPQRRDRPRRRRGVPGADARRLA